MRERRRLYEMHSYWGNTYILRRDYGHELISSGSMSEDWIIKEYR